jgi:putative transposase
MPEVKAELIDELISGYQKPEDIIGENGLLKQLTKAILVRAPKSGTTSRIPVASPKRKR